MEDDARPIGGRRTRSSPCRKGINRLVSVDFGPNSAYGRGLSNGPRKPFSIEARILSPGGIYDPHGSIGLMLSHGIANKIPIKCAKGLLRKIVPGPKHSAR